MKRIDTYAAILAALITLGVVGLVALICWSAGPGPDWIYQAIFATAIIAGVFYAAYVLISTR